jgi:hypothetical protein
MKNKVTLLYFILFISIPGLPTKVFSQNVGIGTATPTARLHIKGVADTSQLVIDANSTQSNTRPLIKLRTSTGAELLRIHSDDTSNTFIGFSAGRLNNATLSGGTYNTFVGGSAGRSNTTGIYNTATGESALAFNTTGIANTACGGDALIFNTTGSNNSAFGLSALAYNSSGNYNTAGGALALYSNTTGSYNTATGIDALFFNTVGTQNAAYGYAALANNTSGNLNTATGPQALFSNSNGYGNTGIGMSALKNNIDGNQNAAVGGGALYANTSGYNNTALGFNALAVNATGSHNTAIGMQADVSIGTLINTVALGYNATPNANNKVRFGNSGITVIEGQVGYSSPSDGRFKENIKDDVKGLDFIMKLQPVSYNFNRLRYAQHIREHITVESEKKLIEESQNRTVGFVAQDVEKIVQQTGFTSFDAVHAPTNETDNYSMGYAEFVVPLVKAVQEQQQQMNDMKKEIDLLKEQNKILLQLINKKN